LTSGTPNAGSSRNDSLIYLQARRIGAAVLTRNRRDFDFSTSWNRPVP
jgi:hypothetical protein